MQCPKCGTLNPDGAMFCFECGTAFPKLKKKEFFEPDTPKYCPKCGVSNPKDGRFCFECGTPLEDAVQPKSRQCSTCGITIDPSRLFCPNCGQSLMEEPKDARVEPVPVPTVETRTECPACGQLTTGDFCRNCGYNLIIRQRKRPVDWWYCDRDSAIMAEIDPNAQILVSRTSLDESLAQAMDNKILQHQDREKARSLAQQLFRDGGTTNFDVLSQVRCPVCGNQSIAPTTKRPRQVSYGYPGQITLNGSSILRNGIFYFRTYPKLLLIILCAVLMDGGMILLGLGSYSILSPDSLLSGSMTTPFEGIFAVPTVFFGYSPVILGVSLVISFISGIFFQCWYYTSLKEIRYNKDVSPDIKNSLMNSFKFLPRAIAAQLIIIGITIALLLGYVLGMAVMLVMGSGTVNDSGYYQSMLIFLLVILAISFGIMILEYILTIFFTYVNMSIVFDDKKGVIFSLKRSWRFSRTYFWTTVGIFIVFFVLSSAVVYLQMVFSLSYYSVLGSGLIFSLIYSAISRLIEAYKSISLAWAYDEFKHTIE